MQNNKFDKDLVFLRFGDLCLQKKKEKTSFTLCQEIILIKNRLFLSDEKFRNGKIILIEQKHKKKFFTISFM